MSKKSSFPDPSSPNSDSVNRLESAPAEPPQTDPFDPFDPDNLRLDPEYLKTGGVKKLLTTVPVGKPNKQDFIRVHPDPDYRLCGVAIIELREERETYLVLSAYARQLEQQLFNRCNLYLATNRQKVLFLWPVKLPEPGGRISGWHSSGAEGAEKAMRQWIRVSANMSLGAYEFFVAENPLADPEWPARPFRDLLEIGFKGRIIEGPEHLVIQRLRGAI
jgi:hypothetical protein